MVKKKSSGNPLSPNTTQMISKPAFPIVGLGASAGGLTAFETFFSNLPQNTDPGMAFVLVQHLSPEHKSMLAELLQHSTKMPVYEVEDGMVIQPNCVYIIRPNRDLALIHGTLQLLEPTAPHGMRLPIDYFFRSLAQDQHEYAIGIVLSGTGSDGTLGVRAIKGEGGMVIVQDPQSTEYDGMPLSAIATNLVDYVLTPAKMPAQLQAYVTHAFGKSTLPRIASPLESDNVLKKICLLLRVQTGHDFSQYKETTLIRRLERRMALQQIEHLEDYLHYLQNTPTEIEGLFHDLLIGVTNFFRNPEAFASLQTKVLPRLLDCQAGTGVIRVWVCGCSTGEEAYSLAILIQEYLEAQKQICKVQIFATDIDKHAIEQARTGIFPASIATDITPERLDRFFTFDAENGVYRIRKTIRDLLIFSEQDVIQDPPFSRLDLIACRNLLIYLNSTLQKRIVPLFHYALNPNGMLFLGPSETIGEAANLFNPLDRKWKIYLRRDDLSGPIHPLLRDFSPPIPPSKAPTTLPTYVSPPVAGLPTGRELIERTLLEYYTPAAVLIKEYGDILYIYGRTGQYLEPAAGDVGNMNILTMARLGLREPLMIALHKARSQQEPVYCQDLQVKANDHFIPVNLTVHPLTIKEYPSELFLVILETEKHPLLSTAIPLIHETTVDTNSRILELEKLLQAKDEYLQTTVEEMETSNEELKSTNEELQSINEELQSTNEELETSREELQSVNEELSTINTELQTKMAELSRVNNDMNNMLAGTGIGTLFVDLQLRIMRFTPTVTQVINLIATDIGRPLNHIVSNLVGYDRLVEDIQQVLDSLVPLETEVQTRSGTWYLARIRPYRTLKNVIEGAVLTFVDVTERKHLLETLQMVPVRLAEQIVDTVREPLLVLDGNWRVITANRTFYTTFQLSPPEVQNHDLFTLDQGQWNIPTLRERLIILYSQNIMVENLIVTYEDKLHRSNRLRINARRIFTENGLSELILLALEMADKELP